MAEVNPITSTIDQRRLFEIAAHTIAKGGKFVQHGARGFTRAELAYIDRRIKQINCNHDHAELLDDCPDGCCKLYGCNQCGLQWTDDV